MSTKFQTEVKEIISGNIGLIEEQAIRDAPGGGDLIKVRGGAISVDKISPKRLGNYGGNIAAAIGSKEDPSGYKGSVFVERDAGEIAAYVEFGTGQSAATYLATVPPEWRSLAMLYYISGTGSIIAQPYLLPAFLKYQIQYVKDLKKALKDLRL